MTPDTNFGEESSPPAAQRIPLERLALLYEGIFTVIVRIQSGKQPIQRMDTFRARMKTVLADIARAAAQRGYTADDVAEANFAVIAFLDEAVLTSNESGRTQWARKTLQEEVFNQRSAGELFFQRLDQLRANRDSPELIQLLEVYYLCLLLGYEGKFSVGSKGELYVLMDNLRERIERLSGRAVALSPDLQLDVLKAVQAPSSERDPLPRWARWVGLGAAAFAAICFIVFRLYLSAQAGGLHALLSQPGRPGL